MATQDQIKSEERALRAQDKAALAAEYRRSHRVTDTREMGKLDLVFGILRARHGARRVEEAYAPFRAQEIAYRNERGDWSRKVIKTERAFARFADRMADEAREWFARDAEGL